MMERFASTYITGISPLADETIDLEDHDDDKATDIKEKAENDSDIENIEVPQEQVQ